MNNEPINVQRLLSIYPTKHGFSYSYFESPTKLVESGNITQGANKTGLKLQELIDQYQPEMMITEDHQYIGFKRGKLALSGLETLSKLAKKNKIYLKKYTRLMIKGVFSCLDAHNKYDTANFLVTRFPELHSKLPPKPKIWKGQHYRMGVFDSVAFAFAYYYVEGDLNSN